MFILQALPTRESAIHWRTPDLMNYVVQVETVFKGLPSAGASRVVTPPDPECTRSF
jgi:hypothetical protein